MKVLPDPERKIHRSDRAFYLGMGFAAGIILMCVALLAAFQANLLLIQ